MTTNIAVNSRSMNGIIFLSDGNGTEISEGGITTNDINSGNITTNQLSSNEMTCLGIFRSNTLGQYSIPTLVSSQTGSLISYGNTSNSGATDFTNYGSTYNTLLQGFRFWNLNSTQTLFNLAIIDNTQTYFKSQLTGCTAETPINPTSIVNKTYVDNNFVDKTTDQTITGTKRFNTIFTGDHSWRDIGSPFTNRVQSYVSGTTLEFVPQFNSNTYRFNTKDATATQTTPLIINSASTTITNSLITNNLTADVVTGTQNIFTNNTTGIINIGTGFTTGTINIGTATSTSNVKSSLNISKGILLYDVSSPYNNFCQLYPSGSNMSYIMNAGATTASTHTFFAYNNTGLSKNALTISYTNVNVLEGLILSCRQIRSSNASSGFHELFSGMTTGGVLTMGSLTSSIINNSTTTNNGQTTFNNSTPICSVATPTSNDHLTRKDYIDNNFIFKTGNIAESISGVKTFLNRINCNGGTSLVVAGLAQFNGNTEFFTTTYFVNNPPISYITPTDFNHLTRKGYVDNNFVGLTTTNSITGVNTFSNNTNFSSSITFTDIGNFSTIQQNSAVLNIENPTLSSTIRLKTRASIGAVQNSLTLNTSSCDILSPTLNLTGASPSSILSPNNLNGTINLFNNLTTGGTINIGSSAGVNTINGNTTITNDLTSNGQSTFLDYIITNTGLKWVDITPSTNYVESRVLGTALGFIPSFNLNSYEFYTNNAIGTPNIPVTITDSSTTLNHQLICNNGAVFNTTLPTSTINASSPSQFTIKSFTDATYQTIAGMTSYLTTASAAATYQTIAGMSSYLTTSSAAATYQPIVVGSIIQMAVGTVPSGYLACNGGSYSISTYPTLSAVLNFTYGGSTGSGLFNVPDFRGMFLRGNGTNGIDSTYASAGYGSLQTDGIKSHTHDILFGYLTTVSGGGGQNAYNSTSPNYNNPGTGSGRATGITSNNANPYPDTRPGNFAVLFCIKY